MAMYLQDVYEAQHGYGSLSSIMARSVPDEAKYRTKYGPPGDYDPRVFAASNIYLSPALMWDQLRKKVGNHAFWSMVRAWPAVHRDGNASRAGYLAWVRQRVDPHHRLHLPHFFHAWLMDRTTPPIH
jgi:hypothetical protein